MIVAATSSRWLSLQTASFDIIFAEPISSRPQSGDSTCTIGVSLKFPVRVNFAHISLSKLDIGAAGILSMKCCEMLAGTQESRWHLRSYRQRSCATMSRRAGIDQFGQNFCPFLADLRASLAVGSLDLPSANTRIDSDAKKFM